MSKDRSIQHDIERTEDDLRQTMEDAIVWAHIEAVFQTIAEATELIAEILAEDSAEE